MKVAKDRKNLVVAVLLIILAITLVLTGIGILKGNVHHQYPQAMRVYEVGDDHLVFQDANGNNWVVYDDPMDMEKDDIVAVIMDNNGTPIIFDDVVVQWQYSGFYYTK